MNKTNLITFALLIAILAAVIITAVIPVAFAQITQNPDNEHYYEYVGFEDDIDWNDAKKHAELSHYNNVGGYLATITSQSENDFVTDLIPENGYAWIGLTDEDTEGTFTWVTGEPYDYTNWDSSQPNNKYDGEHYAEIVKDTGKWNDSRDNHEFINGYVIEYSD